MVWQVKSVKPGVAGWDGHVVLVHQDEPERRAGVAAWVSRGLELGEKVLCAETRHESLRRYLFALLDERRVPVDEVVARGQLEVFDAAEHAYSPGWQTRILEAALAEGYPSVRWSGEAGTASSAISRDNHGDAEWARDRLCHAKGVSILCQYPARLGRRPLRDVCAMHTEGVRSSGLRTFPDRRSLRVAGEVDASNAKILYCALLAATSEAPGGVYDVDLRGLDFIDIAGAKALLAGTEAYRRDGGVIRLSTVPDLVARVLGLVGLHGADGFAGEPL